MTPQELVQESAPAIGAAGASFYFDSDTLARGKELGLDGFRFYFLGRGGVLGDVEPAVVESFGWAPSVEISDDERASLRAADKLTNQLLGPAFAKLSDDQANAFMSGVNAIVDLTTTP
jgi:hypothetical protein